MIKKLILIYLLLLFLTPAFAAENSQSSNKVDQSLHINEDENRNVIPRSEALPEMADDARKRKPHFPLVVPKGWHHDYDYESPLAVYLNKMLEMSARENKNTYIYLYSDWLEKCRDFRKKADKAPYAELFEQHNILLIEYNYFRDKFDMSSKNLPMILKVNEGGNLGPETIHPVLKANQHPRKVFHNLRKFFAK